MNRPGQPEDPADEVDRRFVELMRAEFVTLSESRPFDRPHHVHRHEDGSVDEGHGAEHFSFDTLWEAISPEDEVAADDQGPDEEPWREVDASPHHWSPLTLLGFLLMVGGLLACLVMLLAPVPMPWPQMAAGTAVAGLALLVVRAFGRGPAHDPWDDGSRL